MNNITFSIRKQALLILLVFSPLGVGLKTLMIILLQPWSTAPQSLDVSFSYGLAFTLVGAAVAAHVLKLNAKLRLIYVLALLAFGGCSLVYHSWRYMNNQADSMAYGFCLPLIPAMLITLMGVCFSLGANEGTRLLWRICSAISIVIGGLSLSYDLAPLSIGSDLAVPAAQASITGGLFALLLGVIFWRVDIQPENARFPMPAKAMKVGAYGFLSTLVLMYIATVIRQQDRDQSFQYLLDNYVLISQQVTGDYGPILQSMMGRWATSPIVSEGALYAYLPTVILLLGLLITYKLMVERSLSEISLQQACKSRVSEQYFRSLYSHNPDAILSFDRDGFYQAMNPAMEQTLGINESDFLGKHFYDLLHKEIVPEEDLKRVYIAFGKASQGYPQPAVTFRLQASDNTERVFKITFLPIIIDGNTEGTFGLAKEITSRLFSEENQRLMERCLEASSNAIVVTDARLPHYPVVYTNPAFFNMTGFALDDIRVRALDLLTGERTDTADIDRILNAVLERRTESLNVISYRKNGSSFWNKLFISPVRNENNEVTHFIAVMNDISSEVRQKQELKYQATHDSLTGLANRVLFDEHLAFYIKESKANNGSLALLFIDLDDFKSVNDTMGHKVGDQLLISVTERLNACLQKNDILARFGGDEFVLITTHYSSLEDIIFISDKILDQIRQPYSVEGNKLHISASIGIATLAEYLTSPEKLLQQADMAMFKAKQQGCNTYEIFSDDLSIKLSRRVELRNDLDEAIKKEQLYLQYQPLVDVTGDLIGLEALVRWQHPIKGPISPVDFIPIAEETGQVTELGTWVLRRACLDALSLVNKGLLSGRVAVNLSPMQFHRPDFLKILRQVLDETGLPPEYLELELTEGILMWDTEGAIDLLNMLTNMSITIAIDDFGTGFSSLSYLKELPIGKIKIDKSFVDGVTINERDAVLCKGIITLAHSLNLKIIAEGIEAKEQYAFLRDCGCTGFQGYYFAKPMSYTMLQSWINIIDT
ncbi:EAL domain-containing protein [Salinivibrio sharmensis]|uniref:GGDEF domain-containing protein n=1 Tax=Salinivibrio sharmensis TaxID=390883 RepID=A0ABX3KIC8_9GAMM|nr:EAL domain-containing protein [Salinivibrio sharmensis]OOE89006.1 hypothetical protein BZG74_07105 [Salinivibrio sharmensis]